LHYNDLNLKMVLFFLLLLGPNPLPYSQVVLNPNKFISSVGNKLFLIFCVNMRCECTACWDEGARSETNAL